MLRNFVSKALLVLILSASSAAISAKDVEPTHEQMARELGAKLQLKIDAIGDAPIPGLLQLYTDRGLFYASEDGNYFLQARIYNVENGIVDETENALKKMRIKGLEKFEDSAIEFKADNEKYVITVFTDATCGYCVKLHNEMDLLNSNGVTVRYLAWPRAGLGSDVYRNTVSIWCSKDPHEAITRAKAGEQIASASCENAVAEQYKFGQKLGVNGTPNIILPDGSTIPGYQPANILINTLKNLES